MQLVDEDQDVLGPADFIHDCLDAFLELTAILGARDHEREVESDDAFVAENLRHVAFGDFLRQTFDDGRLAHACFAEQHRVVLGATTKDLNDALDFAGAADDRVHLALARDFREVATEGFERRRLDLALLFRFFGSGPARCGRLTAFFRTSEVRIEFLQNLLACHLDVHVEVLQHARRHAVTLTQQAEQNVLGADVSMIQRLGLLGGEREHFLHPRRVRNVTDHLLIRTGAHLLLDFHADGFQIEAHLLEHVHGDALAQLDQTEQQMLGANEVVVETIRLLARQGQHLLRPGRKIVHGFIVHVFTFLLF